MGIIKNVVDFTVEMQQANTDGEKLIDLTINMGESKLDFLKLCAVYGGVLTVRIADWYIQSQQSLNEFIANFFDGDLDSLYTNLTDYARYVEHYNYTVTDDYKPIFV